MLGVSTGFLFPRRPTLFFAPSIDRCPCCAAQLKVHKTRTAKVVTLPIGPFNAHETVLTCPGCEEDILFGSEELQRLKPFRGTFGYDILVYAGQAMFVRCRSEGEIQQELADRHIGISQREVSYLARKFVMYLAVAHRQSREKIRRLMARRGGYILHLDGTCEGDSPHLLSGLDGITEIVLENIKLASEKAETIIPFLRKIEQLYGQPLALVHDMGKGISGAVKAVFPEVADFICHYHFLAAVGRNLFDKENDRIRARLRKHGIQGILRKRAREYKRLMEKQPSVVQSLSSMLNARDPKQRLEPCTPLAPVAAYSLVVWALEGKKQGQGYGFPFDRVYLSFYQRLQILHSALIQLKELHRGHRADTRLYVKVLRDLIDPLEDSVLRKAAETMHEKAAVFDRLREAMRTAVPDGHRGLNDKGDASEIRTIEKAVGQFCRWVCEDPKMSKKEEYQKMIAQIRHYWEKLFSDPLIVQTPTGKLTVQPQRTNNILERLFRDLKRRYRKKSGTKALSKTLKAILSDTPLVKNLENPEYLKILLDGATTLEERFSQIDSRLVHQQLSRQTTPSERVPRKIKPLVKLPDLPDRLVAVFST
jgi:hypothetical protein